MKTGIVDLPLHGGTTPRWLFTRMVELSAEISRVIVYEYGISEFLSRISDPFWFQGFSCIIGFDWHSSGTTTVTCGALKQALEKKDLGIKVLGGKGKNSRNVPNEIKKFSDEFNLKEQTTQQMIYASRMSAKIDNSCLQDGFQLYHHAFIISEGGKWAVIQQGLNSDLKYARRYHWLSDNVKSFVNEPHNAVCCDITVNPLNMVASESEECRKCSTDIAKEKHLIRNILSSQKTLTKVDEYTMPRKHEINLNEFKDINNSEKILKNLEKAYETQPKNYEELIAIKGIGPESIRALALISDLIYGEKPSWRDPVKYSFAHGGKDGYPYKVNRKLLDTSIEMLRTAVENAKIGDRDKIKAIRRLNEFIK